MRARSALIFCGAAAFLVILDFLLERILPDASIRNLLMFAGCNVLVAVSLNVINGMAGQFSIGHAGFVGIGAYSSAVLCSHMHEWVGAGEPSFGRSFIVVPVCLLASAGVAGLFGLVVGLPSLRLRGDYLAIVTLGFAEIFRITLGTASIVTKEETMGQAWRAVRGFGSLSHAVGISIDQLGGQTGYAGPHNDGIPQYAGPFWVFGIGAICMILAYRIKFSGWGRAVRALREDEVAAAAVGVDPTRYKVACFVIAAMGAGIAGGLTAMMRDGAPVVNPETYGFQASFDAITMVILGGSGSVTGAALGGVFVTLSVKLIELFQGTSVAQAIRGPHELASGLKWTVDLNALRMIIYAVVLVSLMVLRPAGLLGERELFERRTGKS